ncbi:hypothetical protein AXX17_AT5G22590 [Arabidopsis thaliana]|uniref:Uncharacterized protein n=1 Tax=Arabidopsis thaliana TaxID=3702 RepID=A0A178USD3_ARATH|nr:hypothetical protein AXX17_AT5G22590 [Arabidopsis thaliana]
MVKELGFGKVYCLSFVMRSIAEKKKNGFDQIFSSAETKYLNLSQILSKVTENKFNSNIKQLKR